MVKSKSKGGRKREGININLGLLALGKVIKETSEAERQGRKTGCGSFRDSKLTRLLKSSFVGNVRTVFIGCVSGEVVHNHETVSTLRYVNRAGGIKTDVGRVESEEEMREREIEVVRRDARVLAGMVREGGGGGEMVEKYLCGV